MNYKLIDTHCHLDLIEKEGQSISESLEKSFATGVERIVQIGIDLERSEVAKKIVLETESNIKLNYTIGCHPANDELISDSEVAKITDMILENKTDTRLTGIGEIGLDYYHQNQSIEIQKKQFRHFLELSIETNMPVVIHSRDAASDTYDILKEYKDKAFGVIHCFTYDLEFAKKYSELGYYISFSGVLAFKNAKEIHEAARNVDLKNILIETDAPFLSPPPNRGKRNDSSNLKYILEKLFSLRSESNDEVEKVVYTNCLKFIERKRVEEC